MRRAPAALLLLLVSFPLIAPLFASQPDDSQLPACCRRDGKHRCAMSTGAVELTSVPARFVFVSERCPYWPFTHVLLMMPHVYFRQASTVVVRPVRLADAIREAEAGYRVSAGHARPERGPPARLTA